MQLRAAALTHKDRRQQIAGVQEDRSNSLHLLAYAFLEVSLCLETGQPSPSPAVVTSFEVALEILLTVILNTCQQH